MTGRPTILIVDDKPANLVALRQVLEDCEAEIIEAGSGNEALALTLDHEISLAILDLHMPNMDGFELAGYLREDPATSSVPIIFLTAFYDQKHHETLGYQSGAVDFLTKPFDPEILRTKVEVFLELDRSRRELREHRDELERLVDEKVCEVQQLNETLGCLREVQRLILRERSPQQLVRSVCEVVGSAKRFENAWIVLTHELPERIDGAQYNFGQDRFARLLSLLLRGERPRCCRQEGTGPEVKLVRDVKDECESCGLKPVCGDERSMIVRLANRERSYGWFLVTLASDAKPLEAEIESFEQIAGDLAFGLGMIETQRELKAHRADLEDRVRERTMEAQAALQKAEASNLAKSQFLANMSHEIRTPINAMIGLTHILSQSELEENQRDQLNKIDSSAQHLLAIVNDVLDLSKIEAQRMELECADFEPVELVEDVCDLMRGQIEEKGLEFEVNVGNLPQHLRGDPTRLRQALLNLLGNAAKFTHKGRVSLAAERVRDQDRRCQLKFEVRDTGVGIEREDIERLFDAFQQAKVSTSRDFGGTGLGLAITQHLVTMMDGELGVESEPGKGSRFWFTVWLDQGETDTERTPGNRSCLSLEEARQRIAERDEISILLVEDNLINREVGRTILEQNGLRVDLAENGREAVDKVGEKRYDIVLMDVQMPVMDGLEAARIIRENCAGEAGGARLPIVAMTANVYAEDRLACEEAGMDDFVGKPVNPEELLNTILKWLPEPGDAN